MSAQIPLYLSSEYIGWNALTKECALLDTVGTANVLLIWDELDATDEQVIYDLIMSYALQNLLTETTAISGFTTSPGFQQVEFTIAKILADNPGLANDATEYTATVNITDTGVTTAYPIAVTGSAVQSYTLLVAAITADLSAGSAGVASIVDGKLSIEGIDNNSTSTVEIVDVDLFSSLTDYSSILPAFLGVASLIEIFDVNKIHNNPYSTKYNGLLHTIAAAPARNNGPIDQNRIYFDHNSTTWKYSYNDVTVV